MIKSTIKYKTMDTSISKPIRIKKPEQINHRDLSKEMFKKESLEPIAWIALIEPMLYNQSLPDN